jgi:hypothetical protein
MSNCINTDHHRLEQLAKSPILYEKKKSYICEKNTEEEIYDPRSSIE